MQLSRYLCKGYSASSVTIFDIENGWGLDLVF